MQIPVYTCIYIYTCICMYMYVCIHVCMYAITCSYMGLFGASCSLLPRCHQMSSLPLPGPSVEMCLPWSTIHQLKPLKLSAKSTVSLDVCQLLKKSEQLSQPSSRWKCLCKDLKVYHIFISLLL